MEQLEGHEHLLLESGDVILAMDRPVISSGLKLALTGPADLPALLVQRVARLRARPGVNERFLYYALQRDEFRSHLQKGQTGTQLPHISLKQIGAFNAAVAPYGEQERIVAAIEEAFSKLDAGEAGLRTVRQLLKRTRDAILAAAVTGRLVPQDPTDTPATKLLADLGVEALEAEGAGLPPGWAVAHARDLLASPLSNGRSVRTKAGGFPVLRLTCLKGATVDRSESKEGEWSAGEASGFLIQRGDFLVSRGNGSLSLVGRGGLVTDDGPPVAYPDTLIRLRLAPRTLEPALLAVWWNSTVGRQQLEPRARTTAGIYKVNQSMIGEVTLPLPAWEEQARILAEVERQFSFLDACERAVDAGLARAAVMRRSVLKAAFEGKLVPQDPGDEPASVLLERIRAERAAAPKPARRSRRTA